MFSFACLSRLLYLRVNNFVDVNSLVFSAKFILNLVCKTCAHLKTGESNKESLGAKHFKLLNFR